MFLIGLLNSSTKLHIFSVIYLMSGISVAQCNYQLIWAKHTSGKQILFVKYLDDFKVRQQEQSNEFMHSCIHAKSCIHSVYAHILFGRGYRTTV